MKAFAALLLILAGTRAAEIRVTPDTTLASAIERAAPGDTLVLAPGTYRERVRIEKTLTLRGEPGAVLDGTAAPPTTKWSTSDLDDVLVADMKDRPRGLLWNGKFIAEIRYDRAQKEGDWHWRTLLRHGPPLSGFAEIRALWMYHPDEKRLYLHQPLDPAGGRLALVPNGEPLLHLAKARGVIVEGLTFAGGAEAIRLESAEDCVIRKCRITSYERTGILLTGGAARCLVEDCDVTRGAFEEWQPSATHNRANYEIWRIHKEVGHYDRNGIDVRRAGTGNRILRNRINRVFDGVTVGDSSVESLDKPLLDPDHGRGTEIAENVIEDTRDSGLELGVGCIDVNVHHNILRRTHGGLRFKLPRLGPLCIHHNRLIDGAPFGIWFSMDASPAEAYVYHNTIEGGTQEALAIARDAAKRDFIAPRWHFVNNLILTPRGFVKKPGDKPHDFTAKNNALSADAARDSGLDLSTYFHGKSLPGCEPGYFKGKAPDAGADER